jgi:competence protein ComEC
MHLVPFLRVFIPFILGIISWHYGITFYFVGITAILGLALWLTGYLLKKYHLALKYEVLLGFGILLCLYTLGWTHTHYYNKKPDNHVSLFNNQTVTLKTVWKTDIRRSAYTNQFYLNATHIQYKNEWIPITGKILLKTKLIDYPKVKYGDTVVLKNVRLQSVSEKQLPYQFDYGKYLAYQRIYSIVYLYEQNESDTDKIAVIPNPKWYIFERLQVIKNYLLNVYETLPQEREQAVAKALVLGYQDDIDFDTQQDYTITGSLHILAVSGMHVGLIYIAVFNLLQYVPYVNKKLWLKALITAFLVIFYAFLSGASPSIMRAAIMFSFVLGGRVLQRYQNVYNTLCVVFFCMLLHNPNDVFNVGMLLSFAAVVGIVTLTQPIQNGISLPDYSAYNFGIRRIFLWSVHQIWLLVSVCIAAQLFTLPISLYFFHQFPTYFLLSNLIVVPVSTLALFCGIVLLFVHFIPFLGVFIAKVLFYLLYGMNEIIDFLAKLPYSSLAPLPVTLGGAVFLMILVSSLTVYFLYHKKFFFWVFLLALFSFCSTEGYRHYTHYQPHWINFKVGKNTVLMYVSPYKKAIAFVPHKILSNKTGLNYVSGAYLAYHGISKTEVYPYTAHSAQAPLIVRYTLNEHNFIEISSLVNKGTICIVSNGKTSIFGITPNKMHRSLQDLRSGKLEL